MKRRAVSLVGKEKDRGQGRMAFQTASFLKNGDWNKAKD
jgi:hypothetical protein